MTLGLLFALAIGGTAQSAEIPISGQGHAYNPAWSADGQWLAFELNRFEGGGVDLYVVKIQNGNPVGSPVKMVVPGASSQFSTGSSYVAGPVWHPTNLLIFEGSSSGGVNRLFYWKPGGQNPGPLLTLQQVAGDLSWPTVSPDGKRVAFVSDATGNGDIYVWNQASNTVQLAVGSPQTEGAPRFGKDNVSVAYSRNNQGGEDLFVWAGAQPIPRIGGSGDQSRPVWSGASVVFFSNERGDEHWDVAASDEVGKRRVIAKDVRLPLRAAPALSSDGSWVAYGFSDPTLSSKIRLTKVDGSRSVDLDTGLVAVGEPSLVTAGGRSWLAFTALPSKGADWRQLHVIDVTDKLN
jgi:Tol biopolymer transport system component